MVEKKNNKHPAPTLIDDIKNEKIKEKLINILNLIDVISDKKINEFQESVKNFTNDKNYNLTNFLLERHFIFKAVQEINEKFTKNKEGFLLDFVDEAYNVFDEQTLLYWEERGYYDYEDETFNKSAINTDFYYLDPLIKKPTKDKTFIPHFKKLETNLPRLYIGV